jgi:hypothetical protein
LILSKCGWALNGGGAKNLMFRKLGLSDAGLEMQGGRFDRRTSELYRSMYETLNPTAEDIQKLEGSVGPIPEDYKEFLKNHNGGIPSATLLRTKSNERVINSFFALNTPFGFGDSIENHAKVYGERIPKKTIPIASGGGGDLILLNLDASNFGQILYWDHNFESDDEDASNYFENTEVVASSFSEFLSKLRPDVG